MVLGLGALALGLALYWVLEVVTDVAGVDPNPPPPLPPVYLEADSDEPVPPTLPTLAPAKRDAGMNRPPPGDKPPEHIVPEESRPADEEAPPTYEVVEAGGDEEERGVITTRRGPSDYDWRAGAVGRTDATATREIAVEAGRAWIGSTTRWINGLAGQRGEDTYPALRFEAPRHIREMRPYYIDRFEVSNHHYLRFLQSAATVTYNAAEHEPRSLVEIARALILEPPENLDYEDGVAWQLFQANKRQLLDVFQSAIVADADGIVDEQRTFLLLRDKIVPRTVRLRFYDKAPPSHWPSDIYADKKGGYPVRGIALEEAIDYALWDGRHIPSEFEWEYAARGPKGLNYPWGNNPEDLDELVNGAQVFNGGDVPRTLPVANLPQGISWIGCFNMLGNVSEWTSSFLAPYPDAPRLPIPGGSPLLVIRGGSVADEDPLYLRSAYRGWPAEDPTELDPGEEPEGPPRPRHRRQWTGFRTARYHLPGESRVPTLHYRARRGGRISPTLLDPDIFSAWQGVQFEHFKRRFEDDLTRPGVKALVAHPLREVAVRFAGEALHHANTSPDLTSLDNVLALSVAQPVIVGMIHTDLHILSTWHLLERGSDTFRRARCPPGSWYVALFQTRLALVRPDFGDVFFLSNRPAPKALFSLRSVRGPPGGGPVVPESTLRFSPDSDDVKITFEVQIHRTESAAVVATTNVRLTVDPTELAAVRNWEPGARSERRQ